MNDNPAPAAPGATPPAGHAFSEMQYRRLVEAVTDYAIYMLDTEGRVASWNAGAERIKGYRREEVLGRHFSTFFTPEDVAAGKPGRALDTARATGRFEDEGWRQRKDGSRFWALAVLDAIHDEGGKLIGFAKITRDMTERRAAQQNLEKVREQLFQSQKLESLGQLTGGVAHDFNNLLAAVLSGLALIERRTRGDSSIAQIMATMRQAVEHGQSLTNHLLSFSRHQTLAPRRIVVQHRMAETLNLLGRMLGSNIRVVTNLPTALVPVQVDPNQFELAILNICLNARDAMPEGGTLTISAANEGAEIVLKFTDTGIGIPPDALPRVFEPFFTTKEVGKGSGLGLSQVYGFAEETGGKVELESEVGRGTTVTMRLPAARAETPTAEETARPGEPARSQPARTGTVLLVEDDAAVGDLIKLLLEEHGYAVKLVRSATAALEFLRGYGPVDVVFSDIVMPGAMTGLQLAAIIRAEFPRMPVIMTTGYSGSVEKAETAGLPLLRKPCEAAELLDAIDRAVAAGRRPPAAPVTSR